MRENIGVSGKIFKQEYLGSFVRDPEACEEPHKQSITVTSIEIAESTGTESLLVEAKLGHVYEDIKGNKYSFIEVGTNSHMMVFVNMKSGKTTEPYYLNGRVVMTDMKEIGGLKGHVLIDTSPLTGLGASIMTTPWYADGRLGKLTTPWSPNGPTGKSPYAGPIPPLSKGVSCSV